MANCLHLCVCPYTVERDKYHEKFNQVLLKRHLTKFKCCIYRLYCNYGLLYIPLPHAPSLSWKQCSELVGVLEKTSQPSTATKSWGPCFCMLDAIDESISHWTGIHKPDKRDIKNKQFAPFVFYNISLSTAWQFLSQGMNLEVIHAISKDTFTINVDTKWEKQAARIQNKWLCPLRILSTPKDRFYTQVSSYLSRKEALF